MIKGNGNRKRKCKNCDAKIPACDGFIAGVSFVCSSDCAFQLAVKERDKQRQKQAAKAELKAKKEQAKERSETAERKKSLKKITYWQKLLRDLVQQYVLHVRDKGAKCCTCSNPIATEAGHYLSVGSRIELQFELTNIHPQCHECNVYKSGNRAEYDKFIMAKYGVDHFDKLNCNDWPDLKELFPTWQDYESEIKRYRKLLRENGVTPRR